MSECPVCGHVDGACTGKIRLGVEIITSDGVARRIGPERVPIMRGKIGKAGYVGQKDGRVELYDPRVPHIRFVTDEDVSKDGESSDDTSLVEPVFVKPPTRRRKKAE